MHGYPLRWFPDITDDVFHCVSCHCCLRRAMELLPCDHLVCAACWVELSSRPKPLGGAAAGAVSCPLCARAVSEARVNKPISAIISRWVMGCPYQERGCQHRCVIGRDEATMQSHLDLHCAFVPLPCSHCGQLVERRGRAQHEAEACTARLDECSHCHVRIPKLDAAQRAVHARNTVDPSLPCSNLRRCPNACTTAAPHADVSPSQPSKPSSRPPSRLASGSLTKKRRHEDSKEEPEDADGADELTTAPSSPPSLALPTVLPHWLVDGHLLVCPLQLLRCGVCQLAVRRVDVLQHFISHPGHPLVASDGHGDEHAAQTSEGMSREGQRAKEERLVQLESECAAAVQRASASEEELAARRAQWLSESQSLDDSVRQLHRARQAEQSGLQALHEERERLQRQLVEQQSAIQQLQTQLHAATAAARSASTSTSPAVASHRQGQDGGDHRMTAAALPPRSAGLLPLSSSHPPSPPLSSSLPFSARLSQFESRLGALLCLHCHLPRRLLSSPGSSCPCSTHHPSERMLTMDSRYFCCGRPKGSAGCAAREKHEFDMAQLAVDFPDFKDRCHHIRAGTGAGAAAAQHHTHMATAGGDADHSMRM